MFFSGTTHRRQPILVAGDAPATLKQAMAEAATSHGCAIIAYCIMPDHLHFLTCVTREGGNVRRMADWLKRVSGYRISRLGLDAPIWQRSFWDRHKREHESTEDIVAYILNNPMLEALCERPDDWPHSAFLGYPWSEHRDGSNGRRI